jgi:hypothetical protein
VPGSWSQGKPMTTLIEENEISDVLICKLLGDAVIEYKIDQDGDIYVEDGEFPFWIEIDPKRKFLRFVTYMTLENNSDIELIEIANKFSSTIFLVGFSHVKSKGRIYGEYWMSYRYGLIREQFLQITRKFGCIFKSAIVDCKSEASRRD